jgi:aryl carrier-like protein
MTSPSVDLLAALPVARRRAALADLVTAEVRAVLLLPATERLPPDVTVFDLGMTSLRLIELRQRLTRLLGRRVGIAAVVDHPTLAGLLDHLADTVLADVLRTARPVRRHTDEPPPMLAEVLRDLLR